MKIFEITGVTVIVQHLVLKMSFGNISVQIIQYKLLDNSTLIVEFGHNHE